MAFPCNSVEVEAAAPVPTERGARHAQKRHRPCDIEIES